MQICPKCQLGNPDGALRCDCGFDFPSGAMRASYLTEKEKMGLPRDRRAIGPTKAIRYSLHFPILIVAALAFWSIKGYDVPTSADYVFFPFALMGFLHAACIVISLRNRQADMALHLLIAFCFITLAAVWSAGTPILGLWTSATLWTPILAFVPPGGYMAVFLFVTGSAVGALGYWLLIRVFWLKSLRRIDLLRTIAFCVTATLLASVSIDAFHAGKSALDGQNGSDIFQLILTMAWWFAFSASLYWSETSGSAKSVKTMEYAP